MTRWALLHVHCCWVCLVFYSFPQSSFIAGCHSCLSHKGFPNLLLSFISSHINRKTQYENPVLEAKRKKQLEQQQQPPEGWNHGGLMIGVFMRERTLPHLGSTMPMYLSSFYDLSIYRQNDAHRKGCMHPHVRCSKRENLNHITT